jgi:hypothetical protein
MLRVKLLANLNHIVKGSIWRTGNKFVFWQKSSWSAKASRLKKLAIERLT